MAWSHIQSKLGADSSATSATTYTVTFDAAIGNNSLLVGVVRWGVTTVTITSVSDGVNTFTLGDTLTGGGGDKSQLVYKEGCVGGQTTVTVTFSATTSFRRAAFSEYAGIATSAAIDGHNATVQGTPGTGADVLNSGAATTTGNGDLVWGGFVLTGGIGGTLTAGTSPNAFTQRAVGNNTDDTPTIVEDFRQAAAGSIAATAGTTANSESHGYVAMFKAAAAGGGAAQHTYNFKVDKFKTPQRILGPNAGTFKVSAFPSAAVIVTPGFGSLTLTGFPPLLTTVVAIDGRALRQQNFRVDKFRTPRRVLGPLAGTFPVKAFPTAVNVLPGFGSLTITGPPPSLAARVFPGFGSITLTGPAPLLRTTVKPGFGSLVLTGPAPSLAFVDHPGFGSIVLTGFAPTASQTSGQTVLPGLGQLTLTGPAPSLAAKVFPGFGSAILTGRAPLLAVAVHPGLGQLALSGFAPITRPLAGAAGVHLSGFAPTVSQSGGGAAQFQQITSLGGILNPGSNAIG